MSIYDLAVLLFAVYLAFWLGKKLLIYLVVLYYALVKEPYLNSSASYSISMLRDVSSTVNVNNANNKGDKRGGINGRS